MSRRIVIADSRVGRYVAERTKCRFDPELDQAIGTVDDAGVLGGFVVSDFTGVSVSMHMAGRNATWMTRDLLWLLFDFAFNQLGVKKIFVMANGDNPNALVQDLRAGFQVEAVLQGLYYDGPTYVLSMTRERCRWLKLKPRSFIPTYKERA